MDHPHDLGPVALGPSQLTMNRMVSPGATLSLSP